MKSGHKAVQSHKRTAKICMKTGECCTIGSKKMNKKTADRGTGEKNEEEALREEVVNFAGFVN